MTTAQRSLPRKLLVLGATGGTGRLIVTEALAKGYEVSALVRSTAKARDLGGTKLFEGDVLDEAALREAVSKAARRRVVLVQI